MTGEPLGLGWRAPTGMGGLSVVNLLLNIVSLGFYQFWAKADVRRRIWACVRIRGEPLSYAGTGGELLHGFLVVSALVVIPAIVIPIAAYAAFGAVGLDLSQVVMYVAFLYLFGLAVWRAHRYRLSRTSWRGIMFGLEGGSFRYAWTSFWTMLLIPLTLGWIMPWRSTRLRGMLISGLRFGDAAFTFNGSPGPLYVRFLIMWIVNVMLLLVGIAGLGAAGAIGMQARTSNGRAVTPEAVLMIAGLVVGVLLIYGLTSAWCRAAKFNHFARSTSLGDVRFKGHMTGVGLFWLTLSNWFLSIASLGILMPLVQARSARYFVDSLEIVGGSGIGSVKQSAGAAAGRGEGLAHALNFDAF